MKVTNVDFDRGVTNRVEVTSNGVIVASDDRNHAKVFGNVVTVTRTKEGKFSLYSPICRGGDGTNWASSGYKFYGYHDGEVSFFSSGGCAKYLIIDGERIPLEKFFSETLETVSPN